MNFGNNYDEGYDQDAQGEINLGDINLVPGKKRVLNNPNNPDPNYSNDNQQGSNTNFQYNQEANITEEVSDKTMGKINQIIDSIGQYFNVEYSDLKQKLKGALIPFNKSFYQSIEQNADLYGPFWTLTTIIILMAVAGNFSTYMAMEDKSQYSYNFNLVPHAALIIYGFGFGAPVAIWFISRFIFRIEGFDLLKNMCLYGYSNVILIPVLIICIVPSSLISTIALLYFLVHSCAFLFYNVYLIIEQKAPKAKYVVLGIFGGVQFILFLALKYHFFKRIKEKK